jgi:peptide/nickel transport system substrate-binding protein
MKRFVWRWLVISNVIAAMMAAHAETRPQYGGTLHVAMRAAPASLDPADATEADSFARRNLALLMFDTLIAVESNGRIQPALAISWEASPDHKRWQFRLRKDVTFHDGTELTAEAAAASLRAANPAWNISVHADTLVIERDDPDTALLAELALARNAVVKRNSDGTAVGTGPFRVVDWQRGKKLTLAANENYWRGRPFLDNIEIELGKGYRDQMIELEMGKADLVEVPAEQLHRVSLQGRHVVSSSSMELVGLVFARDAISPQEKALREILALSIERGSIRNVLLQSAGEPAASVLPTWMSGYGFVFSTDADLPRARRERSQVNSVPTWTLGYDSGDTLIQLLAERIALNAKDAGLQVQPTASAAADIKLVRIPLTTLDPWLALTSCTAAAGLPAPEITGGTVEELYAAEQAVLATRRMLPLFHLPLSYAAAPTLSGWQLHPDGTWRLDDAWLGPARP